VPHFWVFRSDFLVLGLQLTVDTLHTFLPPIRFVNAVRPFRVLLTTGHYSRGFRALCCRRRIMHHTSPDISTIKLSRDRRSRSALHKIHTVASRWTTARCVKRAARPWQMHFPNACTNETPPTTCTLTNHIHAHVAWNIHHLSNTRADGSWQLVYSRTTINSLISYRSLDRLSREYALSRNE